jgi:hypothetical protein
MAWLVMSQACGSSDWHTAASAAIVNKRLEEPEDCPTRITG